MSASAPRTVGPYELQSLLGRGGMGAVYRARHSGLRCVRAVKLIEDTDPLRATRFLREAGALARVRHPNVIPVHEVGREGPILYFAMELVEGGRPLDDLMREGLPLEKGLALVEQAARGLHAVHDQGLVHRDVKPANIVVDSKGVAYVIDFGLVSSSEAERLTRTGVLVGTPAYFAPEYALGQATDPDRRVDIYALGAILYEIATGTTPIDADTPQEYLVQLASERPVVRPSLKRPGLPPGLDDVCARALARRPVDRYPSALDFAEDLAALRAGKRPSHASSVAEAVAAERARRGRRVALVALAFALVLGVSIAVVFARLRAARVAREAALVRGELDELERRIRKPVKPEADAPELERTAAAIAARAQKGEREGAGDDPAAAKELRALGRQATRDAGLLALWRHDVAAAGRALEADSTEDPGDASAARAALEGGIAALASPSTPDACERAEKRLGAALEKDKDRGDLHLWRAVARARKGDRAGARADAQRAQVLGFVSRQESVVVLALTGDPEEARRAILANGTLVPDPAFARPFALRAASLLGAQGSEGEARASVEQALRFVPAGSQELSAVGRAALDRARLAARGLGDATAPLETVVAALAQLEPLAQVASLAAPDLQDPDLSRTIWEAGILQGNKGDAGSETRARLARVAALLAPGAVDSWVHLAIVLNGLHSRRHVRESLDALEHAKTLATTPRERGVIASETGFALAILEDWTGIVACTSRALDPLEEAATPEEEIVRNELYKLLGRALSHLGRPAETLAFCARAERHGYVRPLAQFRAESLVALGRPEEGLEVYRRCLSPEYLGDIDVGKVARAVDKLSRQIGRPLADLERDLCEGENVATGAEDRRRFRLLRAAVALDRGLVDEARKDVSIARERASAEREPGVASALRVFDMPGFDRAALAAHLRALASE